VEKRPNHFYIFAVDWTWKPT